MNYHDVALLNSSLDSLAGTLLHKHMADQEAQSRQAQLGVEQQRAATDAEFRQAQLKHYQNIEEKQDAAADRASKGSVNAWLQSDDGGTMNFQGSPDALQSLQDQAEQAGKPLTQVDAPKTPAPFAEITKTLADGSRMSFHARNQDEFDNASAIVAKLPGFQSAAKMPAASIQVVNEIAAHRQAAQDARDAGDQDSADMHDNAAGLLQQSLQKKQPQAPVLRKSVTTVPNAALPGNKTTLSGPADLVDSAAAPVITDNSGKKWRYKGNQPDPTKDRNPTNWVPAE